MLNHFVERLKNNVPNSVKKVYKRLSGREIIRTHWDDKDIEPDDIFLVSYPRSGNTWLRYIMTNLRFPDARWNLMSVAWAFPEINGIVHPSFSPRPRWIKSHRLYTPVYPRVIYLVRDGRDVAVSSYHWSGHYKRDSFENYVKRYILDSNGWHHHVRSWLENQTNTDMLMVRYENIVRSPITELQSICKFVGLDRSTQEIEAAIERSSFDRQQADFRNFKPFENKKVGVKGGPGKWKEYFNKQLVDEFFKVAGDAMTMAGYDSVSA